MYVISNNMLLLNLLLFPVHIYIYIYGYYDAVVVHFAAVILENCFIFSVKACSLQRPWTSCTPALFTCKFHVVMLLVGVHADRRGGQSAQISINRFFVTSVLFTHCLCVVNLLAYTAKVLFSIFEYFFHRVLLSRKSAGGLYTVLFVHDVS